MCSYLPQKHCERGKVLQSVNILIFVWGQSGTEQTQVLLMEASVQGQGLGFFRSTDYLKWEEGADFPSHLLSLVCHKSCV